VVASRGAPERQARSKRRQQRAAAERSLRGSDRSCPQPEGARERAHTARPLTCFVPASPRDQTRASFRAVPYLSHKSGLFAPTPIGLCVNDLPSAFGHTCPTSTLAASDCARVKGTAGAFLPLSLAIGCAHQHKVTDTITEAVRSVVAYAFEQLHAQRVELWCEASNERSAAVAIRLGFRLEGHLRNIARQADGTLIDELIYALLPTDEGRR